MNTNTNTKRFFLGLMLGLAMSGCVRKGPAFDAHLDSLTRRAQDPDYLNALFQSVDPAERERVPAPMLEREFYTLGPGDILEIELLNEPTSLATSVVGPDGKIYYSLLPGTMVWGLTLNETRQRLADQLQPYLVFRPEVLVTLRGIASKRVWILGNVLNPGVHIMSGPMNVLEAIAAAGGTTAHLGSSESDVDWQNSFLMRQGAPVQLSLERLVVKGDLSQNVYLQPGDYLYLKPATAREVYVLGMVAAPNIVPYSSDLTLIAAIAAAGGPIQYAYVGQVAIVRGSLENPKIAVVDYRDVLTGKLPNILLEPGDVVYVPLAPYAKVAQFLDRALRQVVSTIALNEGSRAVVENAPPVSVSIGGGFSAPAPSP